jgi:hypothetical protein
MTKRGKVRAWTALFVLALAGAGARAQQETPQPSKTTTLKGGVTYEDNSSESCEKQNENNPYTGMNPLVCYGVMAPTDSRGQCSLGGMQVWKHEGNTCYYCQAINPPIDGFIVPMDQVADAERQGFRCGVDQADACMAVCSGGGTYRPPPGTTVEGGPPEQGPGGTPGQPSPVPPNQNPSPQPPLGGQIGNLGSNPCEPFGPGGYNYCANPAGTRLPAGCKCSSTQPKLPPPPPAKQPSNPINDAGQYLQGIVAGFGNCAQGIGSLAAGAGFFAQGDFVNAAKAWGLEPGQSITLKTMYAELTTPSVGQGVTPYEAGVTAGRRLCQYAVIPGATKAVGTLAKGAISPGSTFTNPIKGSALQDAVNGSPKTLANKWVQTANGPTQLGDYAGQGSFASVFKNGKTNVIKLSRNNPETLGYGPESLEGQQSGAARLQGVGVNTPETSGFEAGGADQPASVIAEDVNQKYPGSFQLSGSKYQSLSPAQQGQVLNATTNMNNAIARGGYVLLDVNPGNITLQAVGDTFKAIVHDPDMVMTPGEIKALSPSSVRWGTLNYGMEVAGVTNLENFLQQPFTAESLMNILNEARTRLITGNLNIPGSTVVPPK